MPLVIMHSTLRHSALYYALVSAPNPAWFLNLHFSCSGRLCLLFAVADSNHTLYWQQQEMHVSLPGHCRFLCQHCRVTEQRHRKLKLGVEINSFWCTLCCRMGKGAIAPLVLNVCTVSWWKISFTPEESLPVTCWVGGWVGPRGNLGALEKREIARPCRESKGGFFEVYKKLKYAPVIKC